MVLNLIYVKVFHYQASGFGKNVAMFGAEYMNEFMTSSGLIDNKKKLT